MSVTTPTKLLPTYVLLVLTNLVWGSTWVVGKLLTMQVPALTASALRFLTASAVLAAFIFIKNRTIPRLPAADIKVAWLMGFVGIFLYSMCFLIGLRHTSAGRGALIIALNPVVTTLVAWYLYHEFMSWRKILGIVLALAGCVFVIGNGNPLGLLTGQIGLGELLVVGCVLSWATYTFIGRYTSGQISPLVMNFYTCFFGALLLSMTAVIFESPWEIVVQMNWQTWSYVLYLAVFATAFSYTWYLAAVKALGASRTALFTNITPLSGVGFGAWFIGEQLNLGVLLGGVTCVFGVLLTVWADKKHQTSKS